MGAGVLQDQTKQKLNDARLAAPPFSTGVAMGLFDNTVVGTLLPGDGNTNLAHEATWVGYARAGVGGWVPSILTADGHAKSAASPVSFTNSSGAPVTTNGWFLFDNTANECIMEALFTAPITIPDGESLPLAPFWTETGE